MLSTNTCTDTPITPPAVMLETFWQVKRPFITLMESRGMILAHSFILRGEKRICNNKLIWVGDYPIYNGHFHFSQLKSGILHSPMSRKGQLAFWSWQIPPERSMLSLYLTEGLV